MEIYDIIKSLLSLVAGVGVFLIACNMMSSNLESLGSKKMKAMFAKTSNSKLLGVGVGTVATAVIQSSSATSVMTIGFVNAGIMSLVQAAAVIFGANIGTTITGQLVALGLSGGSKISTSVIFATLAGIGAFVVLFTKRDKWQKIGGFLAGFGMIFVGLSLMSGSMGDFAAQDSVKSFLAIFTNPFLLVLIGMLLTAVIQSSSVMTSMAITMVVTGLISINQGIYITMGSNIGTCITALIAGLASGRNAKRTALIHVIFNVSGVAVFMIIGLIMRLTGGIDFGDLFEMMFPGATQLQLSMFHTIFNVLTVVIVLPFTEALVKLVTKLIPDKKTDESDEPHLYYVDEYMLKTPPVAVLQTKNEILNMAKIAITNFEISCDIIKTLDYTRIEEFRKNEHTLNFLNKELVAFIVKILRCDLSERDRVFLTGAIRTVSDIERVGDYAENIVEYADNLSSVGMFFSDNAKKEIDDLKMLMRNLYDKVIKAYGESDIAARDEAYLIEESVDEATDQMGRNHVSRLSDGVCTAQVGAQYLALSADVERIADHFINIARTVNV